MTISHWSRTASRPHTLETDVCVLGAGIAGLSAALAVQRHRQRCVILERATLGAGASSRNAGFLMRGAACHYAEAVDLYGRQRARDLWRFTESNLEGLRREGVESLPSYRAVPSALVALRTESLAGRPFHPWARDRATLASDLASLERSRDLMLEDGLRVGWIDDNARSHQLSDDAWRSGLIAAALVNPDDASVNSVELLRFLAARLAPDPGRTPEQPILENQEVFALEPGASDVLVRTADFSVRARHVLVCTNAYAPLLFPQLADLLAPRRGQMLALSSMGRTLGASYYCNDGSEYFRQAADSTIVVGGCRTYFADAEVGYEDRTTEAVQRSLESFARAILAVEPGQPLPVLARWSGLMAFTPDALPILGPIDHARPASHAPALGPRVWICSACTGHGMSMSFQAAHEAVDAMLHERTPPFHVGRFASRA